MADCARTSVGAILNLATETVLDGVRGPVLLLWGQTDEVTPLDSLVAKYMNAAEDSWQQAKFGSLAG